MSTTFTALLPDGTTATRTSKSRNYSFAVAIGPKTKAEVAKLVEREIAAAEANVADYSLIIDYLAAGALVLRPTTYGSVRIIATDLARVEPGNHSRNGQDLGFVFDVEEGAGVEAVRARLLESYSGYLASSVEYVARHKRELANVLAGPDLVGSWRLLGWQSRADLAFKAAAGARNWAFGCEVVVLEAVTVVKA